MAEVDAGAVAPAVPVVPVAPAADAAPAPQPTAAEGAEAPNGEQQPAPPPKLFTQEEVNRMNAEAREKALRKAGRETRAERDARIRLEAELEATRKILGERQPAQPQGEPKPEDYKDRTPQEFLRDWLKWERQQQEQASTTESRAREEQMRQREEAEYVHTRLAEASAKFPDLHERLGELPALTRPMLEFVIEDESGPAVGDYIANNVAEAIKIAELKPVKQVLAMRDIAAKLKEPPKTSAAPPPIVPNAGRASVEKDVSKMSDKEFAEWRKRQIAQRGNR